MCPPGLVLTQTLHPKPHPRRRFVPTRTSTRPPVQTRLVNLLSSRTRLEATWMGLGGGVREGARKAWSYS
jgi:hypothetical protein